MTIGAAQKFILQAIGDQKLIRRLNSAPDSQAVRQLLANLRMTFSPEEFEDACALLRTRCRTAEQACAVGEVQLWWDCLGKILQESENEFVGINKEA